MILNRSLAIAAMTWPLAALAFWVAKDWTFHPSPMIVEDTHPLVQLLVSASVGGLAAFLVGTVHWLWTESRKQRAGFDQIADE